MEVVVVPVMEPQVGGVLRMAVVLATAELVSMWGPVLVELVELVEALVALSWERDMLPMRSFSRPSNRCSELKFSRTASEL